MSWEELLDQTVTTQGPSQRVARLSLNAQPDEVRRAREFVRAALADARPTAEREGVVLLLVSELVTNAVLHGRSRIELEVSLHARSAGNMSAVLLAVTDESPLLPRQRRQADLPENGRGLAIVAELADEWGCVRVEPNGGKTVWFRVGLTGRRAVSSTAERGQQEAAVEGVRDD